MQRRNFVKTVCAAFAGLFGIKTTSATAENKDDYWIPLKQLNGKGRVKVLFHQGENCGYAEYWSTAEDLQDVPRETLKAYPYAFDIKLEQDGKPVYQWQSQPQVDKSYKPNPITVVTEWIWKERRFLPDGTPGPP